MRHLRLFIHGYTVGLNHAHVQLDICVGEEGERKSGYKWNLTYLQDAMSDVLGQRWTNLPEGTSFFHKLRNINRFYRYYSKNKTKEFRNGELDIKANLKLATATLLEDIYKIDKQGKINQLKWVMEEIEIRKARGAVIRLRVNGKD